MPLHAKNILIISYTFPPYSGVGGRRWAKFAKYLQRQGHNVQVIASKNSLLEKKSGWTSDALELKNETLFIDSGYYEYLGIQPKTIFEKIKYRWAKFMTELKTKGNYYDKSVFWKDSLLPVVESFIKKGYNNIIVSGAPFHATYDMCFIKEKFPEINYIVDFRDPWVGNDTSYGFNTLSQQRQDHERFMQQKVLNVADRIVSVNDEMTSEFLQLNKNANKNITINNGFDWDDIKANAAELPDTKKFRLILSGTLYFKAIKIFEEFIVVLKKIKELHPECYNTLQIDFYGSVPPLFHELVKEVDVVKFHGTIQLNDVYKEINKSHVCMLFLTDDMTHSLSTKFYEYVAMKKSIGVFTKRGKTGEFVESNDLGYMLPTDNMYDVFLKMFADFQSNTLRSNPGFNLDFCDIALLTKKVEKLLI